MHSKRREIAVARLVSGLVVGGAVVLAPLALAVPAQASEPDIQCAGTSQYVSDIARYPHDDGTFTIELRPSQAARDYSGTLRDQRPVVVDEWHQIQACVPGLSGSLADSIWQQLECHQRLAFQWNPAVNNWFTGNTYGLESDVPALSRSWFGFGEANSLDEVFSMCGNRDLSSR